VRHLILWNVSPSMASKCVNGHEKKLIDGLAAANALGCSGEGEGSNWNWLTAAVPRTLTNRRVWLANLGDYGRAEVVSGDSLSSHLRLSSLLQDLNGFLVSGGSRRRTGDAKNWACESFG
jgi:hypothetical protein